MDHLFAVRFLRSSFWLILALLILFVVAVLGLRWAANVRETVAFEDGLPEEGRLAHTSEGAIFLLEMGQKGNPQVLFAHGTAAWSGLWRSTMKTVAGAGFHAAAHDQPPFGWSEHPSGSDYSREKQADRVIALLETLDSQPIMVAHSIGAGPVAEAVLRRPDLVSGLVIVDGAIALGSHQIPRDVPVYLRNQTLREYISAATASNPLLTRQFLRSFIHVKEAATPETVAMLQEPMRREGYTEALAAWIPQLFVPPQNALSTQTAPWQALDLPVGLIWGQEDTVTPVEQAKELASLIPGAQLTILQGVGHIPQIEDPVTFQKALIQFLKSISSQQREDIGR